MLTDGSDVRMLLPGANESPAWSPDNSVISVASFGNGDFLKVLRPDGTLVRELKAPDATLGLGCSNWSPDGTRFVCEGWDDAHPERIGAYTVRASDGGDLKRLTASADGQHDIPGGYSPDGKRIAFVRVTDKWMEQGELWIMDADGTNAQRANEATVGYGVDWSPDGRSIVGDGGGALLVFDTSDLSRAPRKINVPKPGPSAPRGRPMGHVSPSRWCPPAGASRTSRRSRSTGRTCRSSRPIPRRRSSHAWGLPTP